MPKAINLFGYSKEMDAQQISICYKGVINDSIISVIAEDIRCGFGSRLVLARRAFAIFVELAQNVFYHSMEQKNKACQTSIFVLSQPEKGLMMSFGNLINNENVTLLLAHCQKINGLDNKGLRRFKRKTRLEHAANHSEGGGIGLIQSALLAQNNLEIVCDKIDEEKSFFSISVVIKDDTQGEKSIKKVIDK